MKKVRAILVSFASLLQVLFLLPFWGVINAQDFCEPVGWATQNGGVTGGGNASPVTVSTYDDLKSKVTSSTDKVIHVSGTIAIPSGGRITIQDLSDKTIIGLPGSKIVSTDLSSSGSGIFYIKRCTNFIMRNLVFEGPGAYDTDGFDNLCIDNCQNFWVDHCDFRDGMDGNFDIKNMSDFISVTWCKFSYEKAPIAGGSGGSDDHRYSNLIGSSDGATGDEGKLNVTFYYCWWGEGVKERMPRMRFGKLHMVNSLFNSSVANNCIRAGFKANIFAEGNYFDNQKNPIDEYNNDYTAIKGINNYGASDITRNTAFTPPYSVTVSDPANIVAPIETCAGATLSAPASCSACAGGTVNQAPSVSITSPADNASYNAPAEIIINATANDADGSVAKVEFYNGTTLLSTDNTSSYSYTWSNVAAGTYTLTAKATDDEGTATVSSAIIVVVNDPTIPSLTATSNTIQSVSSGESIDPIVFTYGGAATDVTYTTLPDGLTASKNSSQKTLTISGAPGSGGSFSVSTVGGSEGVTLNGSVSIKSSSILADWYPFQEDPETLDFLSFTDASISTSYYDQTKPDNGVAYTSGALRLNTGTGTMNLQLNSLEVLKIRWYATGGRTLKVTYGANGTENYWESSQTYESGAHEFDLTSMIPALVSSSPVKVNIINNRLDGGSLNIHDLYVEGSVDQIPTDAHSFVKVKSRDESFTFLNTGEMLMISTGQRLFLNNSKQNVIIFDVLGKTVLSRQFSSKIDINGLDNGVYLLKIGDYAQKFIKK